MTIKKDKGEVSAEENCVLSVWQIDSFEGGKGSRADFLLKIGEEFSKVSGCFVSVVSISAEAARLNLKGGNAPDIISYGAGTYGLENHIGDYCTWCYGSYCLLTLDTGSDFSDVTFENTVVNEGKDNLVGAAVLSCGLQGATYEKNTAAYVKLINGKYKYLFGTQRDIYRLKTRGVGFAVKTVTAFNDLYQDISIISGSKDIQSAQAFIDYLLTRTGEVIRLGMLSDEAKYDDEMRLLQGQEYDYKLTAPISADTRKRFENLISDGDINMLKNLLK